MIVGIALAIVGVGSVATPASFLAIVALVAAGSLREFAALVRRGGVGFSPPLASAGVFAYLVSAYLGRIERDESTLLGALLLASLIHGTLRGAERRLLRAGACVLGVLYVGKLLSYFIGLRAVPRIGGALCVEAIAVVVFTDVFAMLVGTRFGRTPLTPLSPRKTVEGALGGLLAGTLAGAELLAALPPHLPLWAGAAVGAFVSAAAQVGDVVESAFKRDAGIKDAGTTLAGHGGLLDRFDSFLFAGIAFRYAMQALAVAGVFRLPAP